MRCTCGHDLSLHGISGCSAFVWKTDRRRGVCRCRQPELVEPAGGQPSLDASIEPPAPATPDEPEERPRRRRRRERREAQEQDDA